MPSCFKFDKHEVRRAISRALDKEGNSIEAKIEIMAMTVKSSMSVNAPRRARKEEFIGNKGSRRIVKKRQPLDVSIPKRCTVVEHPRLKIPFRRSREWADPAFRF